MLLCRLNAAHGAVPVEVWRPFEYDVRRTTFAGHQRSVRSFAVLEGGRLTSGSTDQTIKIWELATQGKYTPSFRKAVSTACKHHQPQEAFT